MRMPRPNFYLMETRSFKSTREPIRAIRFSQWALLIPEPGRRLSAR
jgi:hypothetical protein